jgi:hypothetical protein
MYFTSLTIICTMKNQKPSQASFFIRTKSVRPKRMLDLGPHQGNHSSPVWVCWFHDLSPLKLPLKFHRDSNSQASINKRKTSEYKHTTNYTPPKQQPDYWLGFKNIVERSLLLFQRGKKKEKYKSKTLYHHVHDFFP